MELTEEEQILYNNEKTERENKITEHLKLKEESIKLGDYEKAKRSLFNLRRKNCSFAIWKVNHIDDFPSTTELFHFKTIPSTCLFTTCF